MPGAFGAEDAATALRARADWLASVEGVILEGGTDVQDLPIPADVHDASPPQAAMNLINSRLRTPVSQPSATILKLKGAVNKVNNVNDAVTAFTSVVDVHSLDYKEASTFFGGKRGPSNFAQSAGTDLVPETAAVVAARPERVEPADRRLQRLKSEVEALCTWVEARRAAPPEKVGEAEVVGEVSRLNSEARSVAGIIQTAVEASGVPASVLPKTIWLPKDPQSGADAAAVRQLVELSRSELQSCSSTAHAGDLADKSGARKMSGASYSWSTGSGASGGGWQAAAEADVLLGLQARVRELSDSLGREPLPVPDTPPPTPVNAPSDNAEDPLLISPSAAFKGPPPPRANDDSSLFGAVAHLHRRLELLRHVNQDASMDQFRSSIQLLTAEVEVATAEGRRFVALEAEENANNGTGPAAGGAEIELSAEGSPAEVLEKLHAEMAPLNEVALRVADLDNQLKGREQQCAELLQFSEDLSGAEVSLSHATELLKTATQATQKMKVSLQGSREQMQKNAARLEAKVEARGTSGK